MARPTPTSSGVGVSACGAGAFGSDLAGARRIFDALLPALRLPRVVSDETCYTYYPAGADQPFFCMMTDGSPAGGCLRVAFAALDRAHVDALWTEYNDRYYAFFFEDGDGNKFEICYRGP